MGSEHDHFAELWRRQEARAPLADIYWELAGGRPGHRIAEVGCGVGYYALRYAALTGPTGHVHATDASDETLAWLKARLDPRHHGHVTLERLDITRAPLPNLHFQAIIATDMLHHVDDVDAALRNLRLSGAPLVVAEFSPDGPGELGPPREHRIAPDALVAALRAAGWSPGPIRVLPFEHYAVRANPSGSS